VKQVLLNKYFLNKLEPLGRAVYQHLKFIVDEHILPIYFYIFDSFVITSQVLEYLTYTDDKDIFDTHIYTRRKATAVSIELGVLISRIRSVTVLFIFYYYIKIKTRFFYTRR